MSPALNFVDCATRNLFSTSDHRDIHSNAWSWYPRWTRSGSTFSPYIVETDVHLDSLIFDAISREHPDPLGSPLTTPPSSPVPSRLPSPEPTDIINESSYQPPEPSKAESSTKRKRRPEKDKKHSHANRAKKRRLELAAICNNERNVEEHRKHPKVFELAVPTKQLDPSSLPTCSTGYVGTASTSPATRIYRLEDLVHSGEDSFQLIEFVPGVTRYVPCCESGKIMVVMTPGPIGDNSWTATCKEAADVIRTLRPKCRFKPHDNKKGRSRGDVNALHFGISIGNGQQKPQVLRNLGVGNRKVMDTVRGHRAFKRIVGFMTSIFLTWAPQLFLYYVQTMALLLESDNQLFRPFDNSPFAAFTVNFGPTTVCLPHRDTKNLAFGWCAVCALGNFDYKKGSHLVLWDCKLVIEFPPGAVVFIPSSVCCHFNTAIQAGEERFSFTTYSAGGLFRWVEHGFQLEGPYHQTEQVVKDAQLNKTRWLRGLNLFSTFEELQTSVEL
ncbi:hypothetical protein VNI00_006287 [Paramarasmius palmivorus]|uniref:Uncharacterized protein n=1 Tax=Paramarasmius palmivorus TaxID=297713 RepID=A0AAW0D8M4_9AGAR